MSVEPERVKIALEPASASSPGFLPIIMLKFEFEPFGKLGSPSLEPGAYLLRAQARSTSTTVHTLSSFDVNLSL